MARKYTKRSDYWNKRNSNVAVASIGSKMQEKYEPALVGEPFYVSSGSYSRVPSSGESQINRRNSSKKKTTRKLPEIENIKLPFELHADDYVDMSEAIELCQKAYAGVADFRNAIDLMAEFANGDIYLSGGSKVSRDFFEEWFKKIKIWNLKGQFLREYYKSGNVFLYRIDGSFDIEDFVGVVRRLNSVGKKNEIALKYIVLNPAKIAANPTASFSDISYQKVLSAYEISRLKFASSEEDKKIFESFSPERQKEIKNNTLKNLLMPIDQTKLTACFYKKQDYEPFAIPFGYPVLDDINAKIELKKVDQGITKTVENVILLITMGNEPDKGGVNPENVKAMQAIMENEVVGRVLVADYTTKAEFIIPDLKKVLGPEKYEVLNEDIRRGLQNIFASEEKYGSTELKMQVFFDRLREAREVFLNDFLQPEINRVAKNLGIKSPPQAKFKDIDMKDQTQLMKVVTRLIELGIFTPEQGLEVFNTGSFPDVETLGDAQEKFVSERKKGFYNPIVGGVPTVSPPLDPNQKQEQKLNKTPKSAGRPTGTKGIPLENARASLSMDAVVSVMKAANNLNSCIESELLQKFKIPNLSDQQRKVAIDLTKKIVSSASMSDWEEIAKKCVNNLDNLSQLQTLSDINKLAEEFEIDDSYAASILHHAYASQAS